MERLKAALLTIVIPAALFTPGLAKADDTTPPLISVTASPAVLWPPDGRMIPVTISGTITDAGSGVNTGSAAFSVHDPYGAVQPAGPVTVSGGGTFSFQVLLQASRNGASFTGRRYSITVRASDTAGNPGFGSTTVVVPYNRSSLATITSITVCSPTGVGGKGSCPGGAQDTQQLVVGPDGTSVNSSLAVTPAPDEHSSVFGPSTLGRNQDYLFFLATSELGHASIGVAVLSGTGPDTNGQWKLDYPRADGYGSYAGGFGQVFEPSTKGGICPVATDAAHQDQTFDMHYAAGGSVVKDPTAPPGSLLMVYEGTNACIGNPGGPVLSTEDDYISLGIATSLDYGISWPTYRGTSTFNFVPLPDFNTSQGPNAPMGALGSKVCMGNDCVTPPPASYGRYAVVTPTVSLASLMLAGQPLTTKYGEQEISGFVDDVGDDPKPFLYANSGGMRIARAQLNGGTAPLQFRKWDGYGFESPGLGGTEASVLPNGPFENCEAPNQNQFGSSISYIEETRQYLLTFVCTSASDPALGQHSGGTAGAAWFYSTSYDLSDPAQWTPPQEIVGSWSPYYNNGSCNSFNGWYPTFMSLGEEAGHLSRTGYVFYLWGCQGGGGPERHFTSRAFSMTINSRDGER